MLLPVHWILCLGISSLAWTIAQARTRPSHNIVKRELNHFEERYIETLDYKLPNNTIKLIGYKRIKVPPEELDDFESHYFKNYDKYARFRPHFYDEASAELRIYFPVAFALVEHYGVLIEASNLGEFQIDDLDGDYSVVGRKKTEHVHGVHGNIIKDGIIYLADKPYPERQIGKVRVYDFGYKTLDHHHDHHPHDKRAEPSPDAPNKGCIANHGGINCSDRYNIHHGRCPENHQTCMDYNGFFTDCKKAHRARYFLGSDCSVSLANGNCWNEVM